MRSSPIQVGSGFYRTLALGNNSTMAIDPYGTLTAWGENLYGQAGTNTITSYSWTQLSNGDAHSLALRSDNTLWGWGLNTSGQLGTTDTVARQSPTQINASINGVVFSNWSGVSAGASHSVGITSDGTTWAWGLNTSGQVADLSIFNRSTPVQVGSTTSLSNANAYSYAFNGANYLSMNNAVLSGSSSDITIEFWIYPTNNTISNQGLFTGGLSGLSIQLQSSGLINIYLANFLATSGWTGNVTVSFNTWTHFALTRRGNAWRVFSNGVLRGWTSDTRRGDNTISMIGYGTNGSGTNLNYFSGFLSNLRYIISNSFTDYDGPGGTTGGVTYFTPSTAPLTAVTGTVLLTCQKTTVTDASTNNITLTNNNIVVAGSIYTPLSSYITAGSGAFYASKVAAGKDFTLAIKNDNTLWSWGLNTSYQLGSGATLPRSSPVQVGTSSWSQVSAGGLHALAIDVNNKLYGWGRNDVGQLADNGTPFSWTSVSSGYVFGLAIRNDGSLWSWGQNLNGELGQDNVINRSSPTQIGTSSWSAISAGFGFALAIRADGTLWAWGQNNSGSLGNNVSTAAGSRSSPVQIGTENNWSKISANGSGFAIRNDGKLYAWGNNNYGVLGVGAGAGDIIFRSSPVQVGTSSWSQISAGNGFTAGIDINGRLFTWGANFSGSLGLNNTVHRSSPVQVGTLTDWSSVAAGVSIVAAIKTNGSLWTWGSGPELGDNTTVARSSPVQVGSSSWSFVTASLTAIPMVMAKTIDNLLYVWGVNTNGQVGDGTTIGRSSPVQIAGTYYTGSTGLFSLTVSNSGYYLNATGQNNVGQLGISSTIDRSSPVQVGTNIPTFVSSPTIIGSSSWSAISAGYSHSAAITSDNRLFTWGTNTNGQLGFNMSFTSIAAGQAMTSVVRNDGTLWTWGQNTVGQIGDSTTINRSSPVQIGTLTNWSKAVKSTLNTFAIKTDGSLWGWGENSVGAIGNATTGNRSSPIQIGTSSWTMVATGGTATAGQQATYAITTDGKLYSWGSNTIGQLGLGDTANRSSPVQIGSSSWSVVTAGSQYALGITIDGKLYSWGINNAGQLADPTLATTTNRSAPTIVAGADSWTTVSAGASHVIGVKTNNTVFAWGLNSNGQLGDSTTVSKSSPVQIGTVSSSLLNANAYSVQLNGTTQYLTTSAQTSSTYFGTGDFTIEAWVNLTSTPSKVTSGTYSLPFDGTVNQYLVTSALNSSQYLGTSDFTIEAWIYLNSTPTQNATIVCGGSLNASDWQISWATNGFGFMPDGSTRVVNTQNIATITTGVWYHVAFARTSGTIYSFLNGTRIATGASETGNYTGTIGMQIGANRGNNVGFPGYISNLRIVKGQSLFSGSFTPATSPLTNSTVGHTGAGAASSLTGTVVLLTGQNATIVDNSSSAFTFTNNGSVTPSSTSSPTTIYDFPSIVSVNNNWQWGWNDEGSYGFNFMPSLGKTTNVNTGVLTLNTWYHVAIQRVSNTVSAWVNGVNTGTNFTDTTNYTSTNSIYIGRNRHPSRVAYFPGYISNLRIIKGQGLFSNTFTPSVNPLTTTTVGHTGSGVASSVTGTAVLLTAQNTTITDNSSTAFTFTNTGTVAYSLNTPFTNAIAPGALFATQISAGSTHSVVIDTTNKLYGWGLNSAGQLGLGVTTPRSAPTQIGIDNTWNSIIAGEAHTIAIDRTTTLYTWGLNTIGQLGAIDVITRSSPVQITSMSLANLSSPIQVGSSNYSFVCTGNNTTAAISSENKLFIWGLGTTGQLGTGVTFSRSSPVQISTNSYNLVNAGGTHITFVPNYSPQLILSTGLNTSGQLGLSDIISRSSPTQVAASTSSFNSPVTISTGNYSSYYVSSPTQVGTSSWTSVSAGGTHTLGIKYDNTLWAWGYNANGQLGGSSTINRSSPVQIGTSSWSQVSAGDSHNIILKSDGTINTFGLNSYGQLGDGT